MIIVLNLVIFFLVVIISLRTFLLKWILSMLFLFFFEVLSVLKYLSFCEVWSLILSRAFLWVVSLLLFSKDLLLVLLFRMRNFLSVLIISLGFSLLNRNCMIFRLIIIWISRLVFLSNLYLLFCLTHWYILCRIIKEIIKILRPILRYWMKLFRICCDYCRTIKLFMLLWFLL